jgi:hypothetical protein
MLSHIPPCLAGVEGSRSGRSRKFMERQRDRETMVILTYKKNIYINIYI